MVLLFDISNSSQVESNLCLLVLKFQINYKYSLLNIEANFIHLPLFIYLFQDDNHNELKIIKIINLMKSNCLNRHSCLINPYTQKAIDFIDKYNLKQQKRNKKL